MSDLMRFVAFLKSAGFTEVENKVTTLGPKEYSAYEIGENEGTEIIIATTEGAGYHGFYQEWIFDVDGKLTGHGAAE